MIKSYVNKLGKSKLIKSGFWYTVGTVFIQGINFLILPILTLPGMLGLEDFGELARYQSLLTILITVMTLSLYSSVGRAKFDFEEKYDEFLSSILFLSTVCSIVVFTFVFVFKNSLSKMGFIDFSPNILIILVIHSFFAFVIQFANNKFTIEYKYKQFLIVSVSSSILITLLSIVFIYMLKADKYYGKIYAGLLINIIYGSVLYISFIKKGKKLISKKYWKYALVISVPLIFHTLSGVILTSFDTLMIKSLLGKVGNIKTGIYSYAYKIGMILQIFWTAFNKAWVPWFFGKMKEKKYSDITRISKFYIGMFSIITIGLIFISPEVVKIMASNPKYEAGMDLVPLIMIGYYFVFLYSIPSNLEFYLKKTKYIPIGTGFAALVNVLLNLILIPIYGIVAAAWTTVISYILLFVYHYIIALRITKIRVFKIRYFIFGIFIVGTFGGIFYVIKDYWILRYSIILAAGIISYIKFKDKIITFIKDK